jgi:hydrogenase nickel incorporation protein HypB
MQADTKTINIHQGILLKNDELARRLRQRFNEIGTLVLNVLSSPGSGKTALLEQTLSRLHPTCSCAVIVGDLATDNDARRLRRAGAPVVQITTGTVCHLEASMIERACSELDLKSCRVLFIENVGNLVCPASYDLGESLRVVLLAVTEGEDKPLKYPKMFKTADLILVTKMDLAGLAGFDLEQVRSNLATIAPQAEVIYLSSRNGEGMDAWLNWIQQRVGTCRV